MPINFIEAVERAKLTAGDTGMLSQYYYNQLLNSLDDKDRYPFTMALVENGILVKTGKAARARVVQYLKKGQAIAIPVEIRQLRDTLENAGIYINKQGLVNFYKSGVPGLYSDRIPQALPLETAIKLWEQRISLSEREMERVVGLQNILSRLRSQVSSRASSNKPKIEEINATLSELEEYGFDPRSKSEETQELSASLEAVFDNVMGSNWMGAVQTVDETQELLEWYNEQQRVNKESSAEVQDAFLQLQDLRDNDPDSYNLAIQGLGGVAARFILAFRRACRRNAQERTILHIVLGRQNVVNILSNLVSDMEYDGYLDNYKGVDLDGVLDSFVDDTFKDIKEIVDMNKNYLLGKFNVSDIEVHAEPDADYAVGVILPETVAFDIDNASDSDTVVDIVDIEKAISEVLMDGFVDEFLYELQSEVDIQQTAKSLTPGRV